MDKLNTMSEALIKYETVDSRQLANIMQGRDPGPPESWTDDDGGTRPPAPPAPPHRPSEPGTVVSGTPKPAGSA